MAGRDLHIWPQDATLKAVAAALSGSADEDSARPRHAPGDSAARPPSLPADGLPRADWQADMLVRTELLCQSGSFELTWPSGLITPSVGLRRLLGLADDATAQTDIDTLAWVPLEERALVARHWRAAVPGAPFECQHGVLCADGRRLVVRHRGVLSVGPGLETRGVAVLQDITALREADQRMQERWRRDEVTGLANRGSLLEQAAAAIDRARAASSRFALMALDVPRIAEIRAGMGIGAGDALAMSLAARLREASGEHDVVARLGETGFAWLLGIDALDDADLLLQRGLAMQRLLQAPVRLGATDVFPLCAVGIGRFPVDGDSAVAMLEAAQTARLEASVGGRPAFYRSEAMARAQRHMRIEAALRKALQAGDFELQYQPKVDLAHGGVVGAEALLRWRPADLGAVSPAEFIPIAECAGLIGAIDEWVMRRVCEQAAKWRRAGLSVLRIGINLSPAQLQRPDLPRHLEGLLDETGIGPDWIGVELSESLLMTDVERTATALRGLRTMGIEISLGDFGTGFSNLNRLSQLPIDLVKIDRSLVHDVTAAAEQVSVTRAIIDLAHGLKMKVLAEGVETEGQLSLLAFHGCDQMQGFCFSPALLPDDFAALLAEGRRLPDRLLNRVRRSHTLLLVDDEDNILSALKRLLRRDGYQIIVANSAAEGLQRLVDHEVDVIISDQRMPGMTGVEFLRRAKALYPDTVRMVLSGYTELQSIIDAVNEGAIYKFLTKPWDDERLRGHVAEAFRHKDLAVLGIDPDGLVAYANRQADAVFSDARGLLGCALGEVLPGLDPIGGSAADVVVGGRRFQVRCSDLVQGDSPRGRLLLVLPRSEPTDA
jgi:diguanylate cyclase (GGDEF)-like protein